VSINLFVTGTKRVGKSTLLKECLYPYLNITGGYYIQRVNDEDSTTLAFRILDVSSQPYYLLNVTDTVSVEADIIAITSINKRGIQIFPTSLENKGVSILRDAQRTKKIVLMDELGKFELHAPHFAKTVFEILKGPIPVIGVLKKEHNPFLDHISNNYADLILDLDEIDPALCKEHINLFLDSVLND